MDAEPERSAEFAVFEFDADWHESFRGARAKQASPASDPGFKQTPGGLDAGLAWVATTCWGYLVVGTGLRARGYVVSVAPTGLGYFFASDPTARAVGARFARIPG